jgi:hypothetical protein
MVLCTSAEGLLLSQAKVSSLEIGGKPYKLEVLWHAEVEDLCGAGAQRLFFSKENFFGFLCLGGSLVGKFLFFYFAVLMNTVVEVLKSFIF